MYLVNSWVNYLGRVRHQMSMNSYNFWACTFVHLIAMYFVNFLKTREYWFHACILLFTTQRPIKRLSLASYIMKEVVWFSCAHHNIVSSLWWKIYSGLFTINVENTSAVCILHQRLVSMYIQWSTWSTVKNGVQKEEGGYDKRYRCYYILHRSKNGILHHSSITAGNVCLWTNLLAGPYWTPLALIWQPSI